MRSFCTAKALHNFSAKNGSVFRYNTFENVTFQLRMLFVPQQLIFPFDMLNHANKSFVYQIDYFMLSCNDIILLSFVVNTPIDSCLKRKRTNYRTLSEILALLCRGIVYSSVDLCCMLVMLGNYECWLCNQLKFYLILSIHVF